MTNYYDILGVNRDATDEQIKNAYRKLAREHHPDKGGNKEHFQKIQEAYDTLGDKSKREEYDNPNPFGGGGNPFGGGGPFGGSPFNFHFNQFFGNRGHGARDGNDVRKCNDILYNCHIKLEDVFSGIVKKIKLKREILCKICHVTCETCNGNGHITQHVNMGPLLQVIQMKCSNCKGNCRVLKTNESCSDCVSGKIIEQRIEEVQIEKGTESGRQFVIDGWGEQPKRDNDIPGNIIINIIVDNHPVFLRNGLDLIYKTRISLKHSIVGKKIILPLFDGSFEFDTLCFGIINPNIQYFIYNRGLVDKNNKRGNLILNFEIDYPRLTLDAESANHVKNCFEKYGIN